MKINFKRNSLALAMGLLGLGAVAGNAHAGAYTFATADIKLSLFNDAAFTSSVDIGQFVPGSVIIDNTASTLGDLTSIPGTSNGIGGDPTTAAGGDATIACQGTGCAAENAITAQGVLGTSYSYGDTILTGSTISGIPGAPQPAEAKTISEINLTSTPSDHGQANGNVNTNTGFQFKLGSDQQVYLNLSAITLTRSLLTADVVTGIAGSTHTWVVNVTDNSDGSNVFSWTANKNFNASDATGSPGAAELADTINLGFGSTVSSPGSDTNPLLTTNSGAASAVTGTLLASKVYTLRITDTVSSNARVTAAVPEPSIIGLMGVGLLGFGATQIRRFKAA